MSLTGVAADVAGVRPGSKPLPLPLMTVVAMVESLSAPLLAAGLLLPLLLTAGDTLSADRAALALAAFASASRTAASVAR